MTRTFPLLKNQVLAILTSASVMLAVSPLAYAQHSRGGGSSSGGSSGGGHATSGGGGSSSGGGSGSDGSGSSGGSGSGGGSRSTPAPVEAPSGSSSGSGSAHAVPRSTGSASTGSSGTSRTGGTSGPATRDGAGESAHASGDASDSRAREGRTAVGRAVARPPFSNGGGTTIIIADGGYGGYYPWAYGGLGFGGYYGYYDPWWDGPYQPTYGGGGYDYDGALRLKVKPRQASVYVDGYFAGQVDDFDGVFQRLKIESGPHRVEVRFDGYETLSFDVRIQPDRTVTYTGELKQLP